MCIALQIVDSSGIQPGAYFSLGDSTRALIGHLQDFDLPDGTPLGIWHVMIEDYLNGKANRQLADLDVACGELNDTFGVTVCMISPEGDPEHGCVIVALPGLLTDVVHLASRFMGRIQSLVA